ncbi:hypothetical protein FJ366_00960 [Candidatus Dependentiae bacterium]|nr:hypothetical protein [Candidatus Dependentiae bacterium]
MNTNDAYDAAQKFIDYCYSKTNHDDAALIASNMLLSSKDRPFDLAVWSDWERAVKNVFFNQNDKIDAINMTEAQAYEVLINFLEIYCSLGADEEFIKLVQKLKLKTAVNLPYSIWKDCVNEVIKHNPRKRNYLIWQ